MFFKSILFRKTLQLTRLIICRPIFFKLIILVKLEPGPRLLGKTCRCFDCTNKRTDCNSHYYNFISHGFNFFGSNSISFYG